ncbi:MAG: homoserine O-acetyltransferase [Sphingomonas sp.]|uniref:homoserine O-acetyltransferase MetX n=1 Tax=Sphingomonas sp. TaxID=28214 RepID=UPI0025CE6935|nr:homoserine O-acetyltransferase [Sphingomonas sp.]MBX9881453.1 homoserine O-acetyltransferase [Sphingomonas sp.]
MSDGRFGLARRVTLAGPLPLDAGSSLAPLDIAYETYGALNAAGDNAVLICHALTGDQHVASTHPITGKPGWWHRMIGPGKPIDPARHLIICANVLGGCLGSTGPASLAPDGARYAMRFPVITIADMVRAQALLLDHLGIETLAAVVGGSMGGMQALGWASLFPQRVRTCVAIATTARHTAQNIAFHEVGRQAIMADPHWQGGDYYGAEPPAAGLAVARMAAHITYLSEAGLTEKFGRRLQAREAKSFGFDADFQVESYLRHQGLSFVDRFDANSYLYITRAMDYFDLAEPHGGQLARAFAGARATRFCVVSFDTDWLYPTPESRLIVQALNAAGAPVSFVELSSPFGHDAFLLDAPELNRVVSGFLGAPA